MGESILFIIILLIAVLSIVVFYRLTLDREEDTPHTSYNRGINCPEGVASTPCPHCGELFGPEAMEDARLKCESGLKTATSGPGENTRCVELVQRIWWHVVCPACGKQSSYIPHARVLLHQDDW